MLVNVITRYPPRPMAVLAPAPVVNSTAFGANAIAVTRRYLRPTNVQNNPAFGGHAVIFALKTLEPAKVQNANTFGAHTIANVVPGTHILAPVRITNGNQFGAQNVHFATKLLAPALVANASQFGAPAVVVGAAPAVSAIIPSDLDTTFVDREGVPRSSFAGAAFVNLDA
jgi:hypothetical protein